jgi:hypothetical protein
MIVHVWRRAMGAGVGPVAVATDAPSIAEAVERAGGRAVMTRADHPSGSDRIHEAVEILDPDGRHDAVVNVQGDLPTIDPRAIAAAVLPLADPAVDIATLVAAIVREEERGDPNVVKLVGSEVAPGRFRALYFTRATAPFGDGPLLHHIGLYAYRRRALARFVSLRPRRSSAASGWSSFGAWRRECGSTPCWWTTCRSGSTRPTTWSAPAKRSRREGNPDDAPSPHPTRSPREARGASVISFQGEPGANSHLGEPEAHPDGRCCPARPSRTPSRRCRRARRSSP